MKKGRIKGAIGAAVLGTALVLGGCQGASGAFKTQEYVSDNDIFRAVLPEGMEQTDMRFQTNSALMMLDGGDDKNLQVVVFGGGKENAIPGQEAAADLNGYKESVNSYIEKNIPGLKLTWDKDNSESREGMDQCISAEGTAEISGSKAKVYGLYMENENSYYGGVAFGGRGEIASVKKVMSIQPGEVGTRETTGMDFIYGMTAVLDKANNSNMLELKKTMEDMEGVKPMDLTSIERQAAANLLSSWSISDKASLLETVSGLCGDKGHNADALSVLERYGSDPSESRDAFISSLESNGVSDKEKIYMLAAYDARAAFGDRALKGWDLSRAVSVLEMGYAAGFLTYDEAVSQATEVAKLAQTTFSSWEEFNQSYLYGYSYWSEEDLEDPSSSAAERAQMVKSLTESSASPFRVDWNISL